MKDARKREKKIDLVELQLLLRKWGERIKCGKCKGEGQETVNFQISLWINFQLVLSAGCYLRYFFFMLSFASLQSSLLSYHDKHLKAQKHSSRRRRRMRNREFSRRKVFAVMVWQASLVRVRKVCQRCIFFIYFILHPSNTTPLRVVVRVASYDL